MCLPKRATTRDCPYSLLKTGNHKGCPYKINQYRCLPNTPTTTQPRGQPRGLPLQPAQNGQPRGVPLQNQSTKRATTRDCPYKINQPRGQPQGIAPTKSINQEGNHKGLPLQPAQNGQPRGLPLQNQSNVRAGFLILSLITHLVPNLPRIGDCLLARRIESVDARRWPTGTLVLGPR